jgi:NTP pyrophosphatase (non-canonical NTP hydrolase)
MKMNDYQIAALRTAPEIQISEFNENGRVRSTRDLLHGAAGLCTEAGELMDVFKKYEFYDKPIDWTNVVEEAGDALWYIAQIARAAGVTMDEIAQRNIDKLRVRYPEKFDRELAVSRRLDRERKALEG